MPLARLTFTVRTRASASSTTNTAESASSRTNEYRTPPGPSVVLVEGETGGGVAMGLTSSGNWGLNSVLPSGPVALPLALYGWAVRKLRLDWAHVATVRR